MFDPRPFWGFVWLWGGGLVGEDLKGHHPSFSSLPPGRWAATSRRKLATGEKVTTALLQSDITKPQLVMTLAAKGTLPGSFTKDLLAGSGTSSLTVDAFSILFNHPSSQKPDPFPWVSVGFLERRIPGRNWEGSTR